MWSLFARSLAVWSIVASAGCTFTPGGLAQGMRASAPAAINATLRSLNEQENQRLVVQLMASPEMHEAARAFAGEIADGAVDALTEPDRRERLDRMSAVYLATLTRTFTRTMAVGLRNELAPAMAEVMRAGVASSLREVLRAEHQSDIDRVATALTRSTVDAVSRGMAEGLARDLIPSLRDALLDERTANALHAGTRALAREVVLGSNDAMTQLQRQQDRGAPPSFLGGVSSLTAGGVRVVGMLGASAVVVALLLGAWVLRLILWGRRLRSESTRLDQASGGRCATSPTS